VSPHAASPEPSPYDSWVFARLFAGHGINGEVDRVSEAFRFLATALAETLPDRREEARPLLLGLLPEVAREALVAAAGAADPSAPAPEGEPWPPLRLGELPGAPAFPLDVLPPDLQRLATEGARAVGCDPGMVAGPMIATAGGLIGRSVTLQLGSNRFVQPTVFHTNVALPGEGKSPAVDYATAPATDFERTLAAEFDGLKEDYLEKLRVSRRKGAEGAAGEPPIPPVPRRVRVDDVTMESLWLILRDNPRGLLMVRDELSALILGLNQ
jgi:hypothetical protein